MENTIEEICIDCGCLMDYELQGSNACSSCIEDNMQILSTLEKEHDEKLASKYSLENIAICMSLCEDMRNPNNAVIVNAAYKWIRIKAENGGISTEDREYFMTKYYHQAKNK